MWNCKNECSSGSESNLAFVLGASCRVENAEENNEAYFAVEKVSNESPLQRHGGARITAEGGSLKRDLRARSVCLYVRLFGTVL